jgi:hypothetical protein
MAYTKTEWKDQNVENPRTYSVRDNGDSTVTLMDAFGTVTELGTPVNAENMNKIENGIANAVDKDSNQTITGTKVFNGASPIKLGKAGGTYTEVQFTSDGSARLGGLRNYKSDDNLDCMQMYAASKDGSSILGSIQINRDDNNGIRATAPHPAASTDYNNSAIMTAGRAADPSQNFNLLHRSGDEIFSGVKTGQSNNPRFGLKHTEIDVTTAPAEQKSMRIFFSDKNNKWLSEIGVYKNTDDAVVSQITANNDTTGVASLQIISKKDGSKYGTCPTPPDAADSSTKIATTAWVNSRITSIMNSFKLDVAKKQTIENSFTAPSAGILSVINTGKGTYTVTIDGVEVARSFFYDSQDKTSIIVPIGAGQKAEVTFGEKYFIPYSY